MNKFIKLYFKCVLLVVSVLLFLLFFSTAKVHGSSMYPTFKDGDFLLVFRTRNVQFGDKIAILDEEHNELLCKRVIGVANDSVSSKCGSLYINDILVDEPYVYFGEEDYQMQDFDYIVPDDSVFVLGDNRPVSRDSRSLGTLKVSNIVGKVVFKFPFNREFCITVLVIIIVLDIVCEKFKKYKRSKSHE